LTTPFLLLVAMALALLLASAFSRGRRVLRAFDPGACPAGTGGKLSAPVAPPAGIRLGAGLVWQPDSHPNPHVLVVGGSGSGKTFTLRLIARQLAGLGRHCILLDFHGDLQVEGSVSCPIALNSAYGVNPLVVSPDPVGGGPGPQRLEVLEQLKNTFRPMGALQLALLEECLKETYERRGIRQEDPSSWRPEAMPDFSDLERVLEERIAADPKDRRLAGVRTRIYPAFAFRVFGKPQAPLTLLDEQDPECRLLCLELGKLPPSLQALAADTLLRQILRRRQLAGPASSVWLYLVVDEAKLCTPLAKDDPRGILNRIVTEGRKFGIGLVVSTQQAGHLGRDLVTNTFTKILMRVDRTEIAATARRFRVEEALLESLREPGDALVHFASAREWKEVRVGGE
jgi:hypothetical protein